MTAPGTRPTVTPEDAARADGVLNVWRRPPISWPEVRGILIAAFADCRHDAYADALADYRAADTDPAGKPGG